PIALDRGEARQRERHGIGAWTEVDDLILPLGVGDGRPHALDEDRARHLHRHPGQHGTSRVFDDARDRALRERRTGSEQPARYRETDQRRRAPHVSSSEMLSLFEVTLVIAIIAAAAAR